MWSRPWWRRVEADRLTSTVVASGTGRPHDRGSGSERGSLRVRCPFAGPQVRRNREQPPCPGYALEHPFAPIDEVDGRAGHQIHHGARHEYLPGFRHGLDPGRDVDGQAGNVVPALFDLAGVNPDPQLDSELVRALADRQPTLNGPRRTVEGGEHAIAGGVDLAAAKAVNLPARHAVVVVE